MLTNLFEYHWAEHLDEALVLLSRPNVRTVPLAGGTYLLGRRDDSIQAVVDLRDLALVYIGAGDQGLRIGAMTTLQQLADDPRLKSVAGGLLARAALVSSPSRLIRNCATLGGTLGAGAASQADLLTALAVLDAQVVLRSGAQTKVNLGGGTFERPGLALSGVTYRGKQERRVACETLTAERRPSELIMEVAIPALATGTGTAFMRVGRTLTDGALLNVAALVQIADGIYQKVRLACGGVNMEPLRLSGVERRLEGQPAPHPVDNKSLFAVMQAGIAEFYPPSDALVSNSYRRVCGLNMGYRALEEAINVARWQSVVASEGEVKA